MARPAGSDVHAHPFARWVYAALRAMGAKEFTVATDAGLGRGAISKWRTHEPRLSNLEATLNAMGYELVIAKIGEHPKMPALEPESTKAAVALKVVGGIDHSQQAAHEESKVHAG